jgi:hypothetical protein
LKLALSLYASFFASTGQQTYTKITRFASAQNEKLSVNSFWGAADVFSQHPVTSFSYECGVFVSTAA